MKEHIYTIPINDAYDSGCECVLCHISHKLENDTVEITVGASMMEPHFRIITNNLGFCEKHFGALLAKQNSLSLALIMQTHIQEQNKKLFKLMDSSGGISGLFKRKDKQGGREGQLIAAAQNILSTCAICDRIKEVMEQYLDNIIFLWKTEPDFRKKFNSAKGYCLKHMALLLQTAADKLNNKELDQFYDELTAIQKQYYSTLYDEVTAYCNSYDYRSAPITDREKSSVKRSVWFMGGPEDIEA